MLTILIIGGAGFIGINSAAHFLGKGYKVIIFDNFSRKGTRSNVEWLTQKFKSPQLIVVEGDIRNPVDLEKYVKESDIVLHLAAQVAVTTSVQNPRLDFDINALGTLNVLEVVRTSGHNPILIYSSTNKVYGGIDDVKVVEESTRYVQPTLPYGVSEKQLLDFHSPYGCSKGTADQYVRDYHRIYDMNTIVFRQSCIYGPHQFGIEDQGWVSWFLIALVKERPITIYGNGKQVRDLLEIADLIRAFELATENIKKTKGQIYNIGGGPKKTVSIWKEFHPILEDILQKKISVTYSDWRPGDQQVYISDIRKAKADFGWEPEIDVVEGVSKLAAWVEDNKSLFA